MNKYTTISFPYFGIKIDPIRVIEIGPLNLHIYGLLIGLGLLLAVLYAWRRSRQFGIKADDITDGVLCIVPFAIICARAYYCIFEWKEQFASDPISVLYIWNGGLAIYGGIIGAVIGVAVFCYFKKIKLPALLDLVRRVKTEYPQKSVWAFSGYLFDKDILPCRLGDPAVTKELLEYLDVLVDGRFVAEKKDLSLRFRGSSNQRLIHVPASLKTGTVVLWEDWQGEKKGMKL